MTKIRALITLAVGKGQELPSGELYDLSDDEAKRLASLNFAEIISKNQNQNNNAKPIIYIPNNPKFWKNMSKEPQTLKLQLFRLFLNTQQQVLYFKNISLIIKILLLSKGCFDE